MTINQSNQVLIKYLKSEPNAVFGFHYYKTLWGHLFKEVAITVPGGIHTCKDIHCTPSFE